MPEAIIETATGLFFVFLLMSLLCSQLVEWIAGFRQWRANALEQTIRSMLSDPDVTELLIDGCDKVYVEKRDVKQFIDVPSPFHSDKEIYDLITAIIEPMGRLVNESNPIVNVRLPDGSLMMAVIPPIALNGPSVTLRKMARQMITVEMLLEFGSISKAEVDFLQACVLARRLL